MSEESEDDDDLLDDFSDADDDGASEKACEGMVDVGRNDSGNVQARHKPA